MLFIFEPVDNNLSYYSAGCGCDTAVKLKVATLEEAEDILEEHRSDNSFVMEGCENLFCDFVDLEIEKVDFLNGAGFVSIPEAFARRLMKVFLKDSFEEEGIVSGVDLFNFLEPYKEKERQGSKMNSEYKKYFDKLYALSEICNSANTDIVWRTA